MARKTQQTQRDPNKDGKAQNIDHVNNSRAEPEAAKSTRSTCPLTDKETNTMLIAAANRNPWGEAHGNIGKAWDEVADAVNQSASVTRKFTTAVVRNKINECVDIVCDFWNKALATYLRASPEPKYLL